MGMAAPLADRMRPDSLDDIVGQQHLIAPGKALRTIIESGHIPNLIFYRYAAAQAQRDHRVHRRY